MEESKWIKQISKDNSIQFLLCEHFIHPTINDCVIVGNSSFRLLVLQSNKIKEVARYDHPKPIASACITYNEGHPEIAFISGQDLYFINPLINRFSISEPIKLNYKFSFIASNYTLLCLYPHDSTILFYQRSTNTFTKYELSNNPKIWSCSFLNEYLVTLEYQNVFKVKVYQVDNLDQIRNIATFIVNYYVPYKLISIVPHRSVYLLCESTLVQFKLDTSSKWTLSKHQIDIRNSDPLLVDAAPCGVRLFVISADGLVLRFDGSKFERAAEFPGTSSIASMTISRFIICCECCRLKLFDADMVPLDEVSMATCSRASYAPGNFIVSAMFSLHCVFYDYAIEVDRASRVDYESRPSFAVSSDCVFVLFEARTVVLDSDFKDVTPAAVRHLSFERVHANSRNSFFACTAEKVYVYEYGSFSVHEEKSTLSSHRLNSIVTADNRQITVYLYLHGTLLKQAGFMCKSSVSSLLFREKIYAALFDESLIVLDDELNVLEKVDLGFISFSIVSDDERLVFGLGDGRLAVSDMNANEVKIRSEVVGNSTVHLACVGSEVTCMCDGRYFYVTSEVTKELPPDFLFFGAFTSRGSFVGLLRRARKGSDGHLVQLHFTDKSLGFRSEMLYEFNAPVTKLCCARKGGGEFACCLGQSELLWSRHDARFTLPNDECVCSLDEWRACYKGRSVQLWMCCTRRVEGSRLLIFTQSQSSGKVQLIFEKSFELPISSFAVSSATLAFFASGDSIHGISLETGALTSKCKTASRINDVVALSASEKHLAAIADKNEFAVFEVASERELRCVAVVRRAFIFGRVCVVGKCVAVSSRVSPELLLFRIGQSEVRIVREVRLLSPVSAICLAGGNALVSCVCGEVFVAACEEEGEVNDLDVSRLFSFSSTALSISD